MSVAYNSTSPDWMLTAYRLQGVQEVKGVKHNPIITGFWKHINPHILDDETPWCAAFVSHVLESNNYRSSRKANARSYMQWGQPLNEPRLGCVVVFWRGSKLGWKGHVGFVVGRTPDGQLAVLGGNQGDCVSIKAFPVDRVLGYRWPVGRMIPPNKTFADLPMQYNLGKTVSEA